MKKLNLNLLALLLIATTVFTLSSCSDDSEDPTPTTNNNTTETNTIVDVAMDNDFTILVDALKRADLVSTLSGEGSFTVFAPTDKAFMNLLAELKLDSLGQVPVTLLKEILLNHVVSGEVMSSSLSNGYVKTLANGPQGTMISMLVNTDAGVMLNKRAKVSSADIKADNGIVHVIDEVITIPSVVDIALSNPEFSILVKALTNEKLNANFVEILSGDGPFTVFAPTNKAFENLLNSNMDWNSLDDIPTATLEAVLKHHVIANDNVTASEITDGMTPETFQGSKITINTMGGVMITDGTMEKAQVTLADVQGSNGVIHVINKVLIP